VTSTKKQKMSISRSIVEAVRSMNPPGRFLDKDSVTGLWSDIGDRKAIEKTSQALRDGAANLRKQLSEDLGDPDFLSAVFEVDNSATSANTTSTSKASLKDKNKPSKTKSVVKKGHRRTTSNPNTLQEKKKVLVVVKTHHGPRGEEILVAEQRQHHHHRQLYSGGHHPISPTTTLSPFRSLSGSPLVHGRPSLGRASSFEYARRRSYQVAASRNSTPSPSPSSPHQMHHPGAAAAAAAYHYHQQQRHQQQQQARQAHGGGELRGYPSKGAAGQSYESWMGYPSGHPYYRSPPPPPPGQHAPPPTQQHPSGYRSPTGAADVRQAFSPVQQGGGSVHRHHQSLSPSQDGHHHQAALSPNQDPHRQQQQHHVVLSPNQAAHYHAGYYQHSPHGQYPGHGHPSVPPAQPHYHRPPVSPSMNRPWSPRSFAAAANNMASPPPPPPSSHAQAQHAAAAWHHGQQQQRPSPATAYPAYSNGDLNVPNLNTSRPGGEGGGGAYHPSPNAAGSYHHTRGSRSGTASPNESMLPRVIRSASAEDFAPPISPTSSWVRQYPERRTMSPREIPDRREEDEEKEAIKRPTTSSGGGGGGASNNNITSPETMSTGSLSKSSSSCDSSMSSTTKPKKLSSKSSDRSSSKNDHHSGYRSPTIVVSDAVGEDEKMSTESPGKSDIEVIYREGRDGEDTFMSDNHGDSGGNEERTSSHTRSGPALDEDDMGNSSDISVDDSLAPLPFEPEEPARAASPHMRGCQSTRHFFDMIPESLLQMPIAPCGPQDED
jgi:hypothetical protein